MQSQELSRRINKTKNKQICKYTCWIFERIFLFISSQLLHIWTRNIALNIQQIWFYVVYHKFFSDLFSEGLGRSLFDRAATFLSQCISVLKRMKKYKHISSIEYNDNNEICKYISFADEPGRLDGVAARGLGSN